MQRVNPFHYIDRFKFTTAVCLLGAGIFHPFKEINQRLFTLGIGCSTLAAALNPLRGRIHPAGAQHLLRFQAALFVIGANFIILGSWDSSTSKQKISTQTIQ